MSLYATRELLLSVVTVAAVNTEIDALNTALGTTCPHIGAVLDGLTHSPEQAGTYPCLLHFVPASPAQGEHKRTGKRDFAALEVALQVVPRGGDLESDRAHSDVMLEALLPLIESLHPLDYATDWGILNTSDPKLDIVPSVQEGTTIRMTGIARFTVLARRAGL